MKLAFALVSAKPLHFAPHHWIKLHIEKDGQILRESVGEDRFAYNGMLLSDTPVAATGRSCLHTFQPDLESYKGGDPVEVELPDVDSLEGLTLVVDSNLILSQGELQTYYTLFATVDGRKLPLSLLTPLMPVDWQGKGRFSIQLSSVCLCPAA